MDLIIGASGQVGRRVVDRLLDRGRQVRAASRDPDSRLAGVAERGAETVSLDVRDEGSVRRAVDGVDRIVMAHHGLVPPSRDNHPGLVDVLGSARIIEAAAAADVAHLVYCSTGAGEDEPQALFLRAKRATERRLAGSGLSHTAIRFASVFMENHALSLLGDAVKEGQPARFIGRGQVPIRWLTADDAADHVVAALTSPTELPRRPVSSGTDLMTRVEALETIEEVLGAQAKRSHLSLPVARLMRTLAGPLNPGLRFLLDLAISEESGRDVLTVDPATADLVGTTTLREVVQRWAA